MKINKPCEATVGQASSLPVQGASSPVLGCKHSSKIPKHASHSLPVADAIRRHFPSLENASNDVWGPTQRLQRRRGARFLARLRRAVLHAKGLPHTNPDQHTSPSQRIGPGRRPASYQPRPTAWVHGPIIPLQAKGLLHTSPRQAPWVHGSFANHLLQAKGLPHNFPSVRLGAPHSALHRAVLPIALIFATAWAASNALALTAIKSGNRADAAQGMPMVLKVLKRSTGPNSTAPQNPTVVPAPTQNSSDDDTPVPDPQAFGFLRLVSPKKEFYVGELVPVELKAFFRAGVELRVDGLPKLNSDAFTMNKLGDQPDRSEQTISGVPYIVLTWSTALTAVKAGDYEMSVELPTTVTVHQRAQRPHPRQGNPFGDPFFDDFFNDAFFDRFFGSASQKEVALSSEPSAVKILSVPAENRPASFTGAVGKFELAAEAAPLQAAVGDPVTLKLKISGSGNFDRANATTLEKNDQWKTYKPAAKFEPDDNSACSGTKTFEQALVPVKSGQLTIPSLAFSYFDPESKRYVTRTTPPLSINVIPSATLSAAPTLSPSSTLSASTLSPAATLSPSHTLSAADPASALLPNKLSPGRFHSTLRPWFLNPLVTAAALLPSLGLFAAYWFLRRRQKLARDPQRLRLAEAHRAMQAHLQIMENAATQGATLEFFTAARGAFQNQLSLHWGLLPKTITLAEINARMNGEADSFRFVFELADEVTYTGRTFAVAELQKWYKVINAELKKLQST